LAIVNADQILVLKDGIIIERGTLVEEGEREKQKQHTKHTGLELPLR